MAFDLEPEDVSRIRRSYAGETPPAEDIMAVAEIVQQEYVDGPSAAVGNITTYEGVQSMRTRRPLSASVDLLMEDADVERLGEAYDSWTFKGAYFAAVDDIEVAVIDRDAFELFKFPESTVVDRYEQEIAGHDITVADPVGNIASKFNRLVATQQNTSAVVKGSDPIDMASHLHWYHAEDHDMQELASTVTDRVEPPYVEALDAVRNAEKHFRKEERDDLEDAVDAFADGITV